MKREGTSLFGWCLSGGRHADCPVRAVSGLACSCPCHAEKKSV